MDKESASAWMRGHLANSSTFNPVGEIFSLEVPTFGFVSGGERVGGRLKAKVSETLGRLPHLDDALVVSGEEKVTLDVEGDAVDVVVVAGELLGNEVDRVFGPGPNPENPISTPGDHKVRS